MDDCPPTLDMAPMVLEHPAVAGIHYTPEQLLLSALESSSNIFLLPTPSLHAATLASVKRYLDPLASSTSVAQAQRQQISRQKRKRGDYDADASRKPLQLKQVHLEGLRIEQIWEQAKRILDATRSELERSLPAKSQLQVTTTSPEEPSGNGTSHKESTKLFKSDEDGFKDSSSISNEPDGEDSMHLGNLDGAPDGMDQRRLDGDMTKFGHTADDDDENMLDGDSAIGEEDPDDLSETDEASGEIFHPDKNGLNDGFFSIDDFNRQSEFLEQQDARGENDGAASEEEDVDWDVDPLAVTSSHRVGQMLEDEVMEESEGEEDGPTFGNVDLDAPDISDDDDYSANQAQLDGVGAMNNTNDIKYADFFAPPPSKASKASRRRALPKTQPPPTATEDDVQRTISAVRRDIFEDDLTPDEDNARPNGKDGRSSRQKRQAALTAEIRRLEAASVAKRDWTLSGEARAADRPINSLLEEDIEFERTGKPIPVVTQEVSEDIEALIKRRIIARAFDEVIRRRPGNLATGNEDVRRGRFELDDTKPQQSLAEMYEAEHLKTADPEGYTDKRDEKLKREHAKIEQMWKDISAKLDALSSWHYKPKPPSASINVVADVPTISIEDARPAGGGEVGGESMLAPQEVYKPGEGKGNKEEVLKKGSGVPIGREEMTRDEKVRRRRREKERIRKAGGLGPTKGLEGRGKKSEEKRGVIGDLKKGGVRVIGKKGEIRDVEGKAVQGQVAVGKGVGGYKL